MKQPTGLHHASLSVNDLEASVAWYRAVFGVEVAFAENAEERRGSVLQFADGSAILGLVQHGGGSSAFFDPTTTGLDHLAFTVEDRAELDAWARQLDGLGVPHSGVSEIPPGAILNFKDPDGIALALFWDR